MIWWRWDVEGKCWRPTRLPADGPFDVGGEARLVPIPGMRCWALLAQGDTTLNGLPCLPIEILDDRDEVRIARGRYVFTTDAPPEVVTLKGVPKKIRCARCLGRLVDSDRIVQCPGCRAHHHETCWTYDARCQKCPFLTDGRVRVPESLN